MFSVPCWSQRGGWTWRFEGGDKKAESVHWSEMDVILSHDVILGFLSFLVFRVRLNYPNKLCVGYISKLELNHLKLSEF